MTTIKENHLKTSLSVPFPKMAHLNGASGQSERNGIAIITTGPFTESQSGT